MNIVVTGGAGFIGSEIVRQLVNSGNSVLVLDNLTYSANINSIKPILSKLEFCRIDIANEIELNLALSSRNIDVLIHCAAETHVDNSIQGPEIFLQTNIIGTFNLIKIAAKRRFKFIQVSTDEVYGSIDVGAFTELDRLNPSSPYSASKASGEMMVMSYGKTFGLEFIIVRCANNYGPFQHTEKLIPHFINKLLSDQRVPLYGNGLNYREWIHVSDCANAIIKVAFEGRINSIYNISSQDSKSNLEVANMLISLLNCDASSIEFVADRLGHDLRYAINSKKIQSELGWFPKIDFEAGLRSTIDWYQTYGNEATEIHE